MIANQDRLRFLELVCGYAKSKALEVAARLRIADHLAGSGKTSVELAALTSAHPSSLHRLLCALANMGIVSEGSGTFTLTSLGRECLATDSENSLEAVVRYLAHDASWATWAELLHSVKTGQPAFPQVHGESAWDYRAKNPDLNRVFNAAMRAISNGQKEAIASSYDFSAVGTLVDVGGGSGTLLADLVARHPRMRGVLFDQPHVVAGAEELLRAAGVADRCEIVAGNFFERVPRGGDLYLMRAVIHNWDDEQAKVILGRCRCAMADGSRLLLVEGVLKSPGDGTDRFWPSFLDLHMLVTLGGRQRTAQEFAALYASSGFRLTTITDLPDDYAVIEGEPIQI